MNIMYCIFSFNMGGIERLLIDMSRAIVRRGHHVWLCVINEDYNPSLLNELDPAVQMVLLHRVPGETGVLNTADPAPVSSGSEPDTETATDAASDSLSGDKIVNSSDISTISDSGSDTSAFSALVTKDNGQDDSLKAGAEGSSSVTLVGTRQAMLRLSSIIHENHIEILHCQGINCVLFAAAAKLRNPGLRILNTVHDTGNYTSYSTGKVLAANLLLNHTIAISKAVREEILSRPVNPKKVTTIYNGVNTEKFSPADRTGQGRTAAGHYATGTTESNERTPSGSSRIEIGCVARFFPAKKGQDLLVAAMEQLHNESPDLAIHCTIAGDIYKGQQEEYDRLTGYVRDHGLTGLITFSDGLAPDEVPDFLRTVDLFALPSRYEGFGITLIEAMACGIPCVAANLQGPAEIITEESLGLLFEPGDADALAAGLRQSIERLKSGYYDAQYIISYVRNHFDMETMTQRHLELYQHLLQHRSDRL